MIFFEKIKSLIHKALRRDLFKISRSVPNNELIGGFSLIELMVTITIFVMVTSITLTSYPKFSNKLSLDLLAQDIALSLRQAQISGSSVLGARNAGLGQLTVFGAYGIHMEDPNFSYNSTPYLYSYSLFADIDKNRIFTDTNNNETPDTNPCGGATIDNECAQKFQINGRNKVKYLCYDFDDPAINVNDRVAACAGNAKKIAWLDIVFERPNLDAKITIGDGINPPALSSVSNVGIVLESPGGDYYKTVVVWKTGQISVE